MKNEFFKKATVASLALGMTLGQGAVYAQNITPQQALNNASVALQTAKDKLETAKKELETIKTEKVQAEKDLDLYKNELKKAQEDLAKLEDPESKKVLEELIVKLEGDLTKQAETLKETETKLKEAKENFDIVKKEYDTVKTDYDEKLAEQEKLNTILQTSNTELNNAKKVVTELENTIKDSTKKVQEAEKSLKELNELKANSDTYLKNKEEALNKAQTKLTEAEGILKEKETALANINSEISSLKTNLSNKNAELTTLQSELTTANTKLAAAETQLKDAETKLQKANEDYEIAVNDVQRQELVNQIATLEKEIEIANQNVETAKGLVNQTYNEVLTAEKNVETVRAELKNKEAIKTTLETEKQQIIDNKLTPAQNAKNEAFNALETAKTNKAKAEQELAELVATKATTEQKISELQSQVNKLTQIASMSQADIDAAIKAAEAQIAKGSLGFFEEVGDTVAVKIINDNISKGYVKLGDPEDATSLKNFKEGIKIVKESNFYRAKEAAEKGITINPLKVSSQMMAISQVQTNAGDIIGGHSNLYAVGENLAWGYRSPRSPFAGWYTHEKKVYDYVTATPERYKLFEDKDEAFYNEVAVAMGYEADDYGRSLVQIGHYQQLVDPDLIISGGACNSGVSDAHRLPTTHGQVFNSINFHGTPYTVEDYEAMVDNYISNVNQQLTDAKNLAQAKADAKAKLPTAKAELERANIELGNIVSSIETMKSNILAEDGKVSEAQRIYDSKAQLLENVEKEIAAKETEITKAQTQIDIVNGTLTEKQGLVGTANKNWEDAKKDLVTKQTILTNKTTEKGTLENKLNNLPSIGEALAAKESAKKVYDKNLKLRDAEQKIVDGLNGSIRGVETAISTLEGELLSQNEKAKTATTQRDTASNVVITAKQTRDDLKLELDNAKMALNDIDGNIAKVSKLKEENEKLLAKANASLPSAKGQLSKLSEAQKVAQTNYDKKAKEIETLKEILNTKANNLISAQEAYDLTLDKQVELMDLILKTNKDLEQAKKDLAIYNENDIEECKEKVKVAQEKLNKAAEELQKNIEAEKETQVKITNLTKEYEKAKSVYDDAKKEYDNSNKPTGQEVPDTSVETVFTGMDVIAGAAVAAGAAKVMFAYCKKKED